MMNKIAVNPTQFITCRLCFEELGNYQIVPSLKEQIDYCFGIKIEPYDGLPQLICEKCEVILSNYSQIKKKFIVKQDELRSKIQQGSQGKLTGAQQHTGGSQAKFEFESNKENRRLPTKKKNCNSSSSSDQEWSNTFKNKRSKRDSSGIEERSERDAYSTEEIDDTWPASYTKQFVCRICSSHWSSIKALRNHINKIHGRMYKKFNYVFKRHCQVKLHKIDGKANVTGSRSKVVYSREKIVKNVNAEYHIIYTTKDYKGDDRYHESNDEVRKMKSKKRNKNLISDSSDEDIVVTRKRRKRIYSSSSNETVVLDCKPNVSDNYEESQKTAMVQLPAACIDLTDSSDSESVKSMNLSKTTPEKQLSNKVDGGSKVHMITINDIITTCQTKYLKKLHHENNLTKNSSDIANKLLHKICSIGRKIINKRIGVNCTPLMRFVEHKNLDIAWLPRAIVNVTESSNYIRIMPRRKNNEEKLEESETGWTFDDTLNKISSSMSNNSEQSHSALNVYNGISSPENPSVSTSDAAVITSDATIISTETKLLNENPVANPKQLPKKFVSNELKLGKLVSMPLETPPQEDNNSDMCMPIITSTTSLAVQYSIQDDEDDSNKRSDSDAKTTDKQQAEPPRIKVKPASELMSVEMLNRMQNPTQNYTHIPVKVISKGVPVSVHNISLPVSSVPVIVTSQNTLPPNKDTMASLTAHQPALQNEFMILDTIELPNTKTNSPYLYFKKLLQIHNIILLDTHVELSEEFNCLLKFKVLYRQNTQLQPVTLCLGLYCSTNVFCLKIKDRNNENLDITQMSPNWQWEILKVYKGEVVNKMLNCAQKISQAVHTYANSFVCILKSINVK